MSQSEDTKTMAAEMASSLARLWKRGVAKDLTVVVEGERIQCHSFIMCACSTYFRDRLRTKRNTRGGKTIVLMGMDPYTFKLVLDLLYTSQADSLLTHENVWRVWHVADRLRIDSISKACMEYFMKKPTLENYRNVYAMWKRHPNYPKGPVMKFFSDNFTICSQSDAFLDLTPNDIYYLVQNMRLVTSSEETVINSIFRWVSQKNDIDIIPQPRGSNQSPIQRLVRKSYLVSLLKVAKLYTLSKDYLETLLENSLIVENSEAKELIEDAVSYHQDINRRHGEWLSRSQHRIKFAEVNLFVRVHQATQFMAASTPFHETYHLPRLPCTMTRNIQLLVHNNSLIAIGRHGFSQKWSVFWYLDEIAEWSTMFLLNGEDFRACSCSDFIYIFDTHSHRVIRHSFPIEEDDDILELRFKKGENIIAVTSQWGLVIVFSKTDQKELTETSVHYLDVPSRTWTRLESLKGEATNLICFRTQERTLVIQETGHVWELFRTDDGEPGFRHLTRLWENRFVLYGVRNYGLKTLLFISLGDSITPRQTSHQIPGIPLTILVTQYLHPFISSVELCVSRPTESYRNLITERLNTGVVL